jgi:NAD(P)-dependent dehydrogenase (short-subunit alcohol dehydrogenase family)
MTSGSASLGGRTAVVTGGGRGLGRAFAQALAAEGAAVTVIARSGHELAETVASIGVSARSYAADVTDAAGIQRAFERIGTVDLLVNNAGIIGPIGPFWETDVDEWWRAMDVNVRGAMLCMKAVLPAMIARRSGRIVNIVSGAIPAAHLSSYLTTKTALARATECIAAEASTHGVSLFAVAPGTVRTRMSTHSVESEEGRRWIPWFRRIFDEGLDLPAGQVARRDALAGLYLTPRDDLDVMTAQLASVKARHLHSLRVTALADNAAASAIAAIRDSAV